MSEPTRIPTGTPIWSRFFTLAPIVIVGTREADGGADLAPKHMAMPLGWQNHYCFVCSPRHATQRNIERQGQFTVSFPRPDQMLAASLAAGPREESGAKPSLDALETVPARKVDGVLVEGCYLYLECELDRIVHGFGENSLIVGTVVEASAAPDALREADVDDADLLHGSPIPAYLSPGRFAVVRESYSFPFPADFSL